MFRYVLKRLGYIIIVFLVASVLIFGLYKAVPGDPARMLLEGNRTSMEPEVYERQYNEARAKLGLDRSLPEQYFRWITRMLTGDFGYSIQYKQNVAEVIKIPMSMTIRLNLMALLPTFLITIPLGIMSAVRRGSKFDTAVQVISIIGYSLPLFVVALIALFFFSVKLGWFPISGSETAGSTLVGWARAKDMLWHMALPLFVMVFSSLGSLIRYVRVTMIEALRMDCIRTARAKGLREKTVVYVHAFRNALIPFITVITAWFTGIFSGSVALEQTFVWNGMGKAMIQALNQQDYSVSMALMMFYLVLTLVANLVMDLMYGVADPRVKLA